MNDKDTISDAEETGTRPRSKTRRTKPGRNITFERIQDGKPIKFGTFPEAVIGEPLERRLLPFIEERNFGGGDWKVDVRNARGHFEQTFSFSIADTEADRERTIDIEMDANSDDTEEPEYDTAGEIELRAELISMRRELKDLRQQERERHEAAKDSENNALAMIREMQKQSEKSFQQGLQMAQMIMQSSQPKENPSELMLSMLKGTLEVQRGVRQLSEEISPNESNGPGGSLLADGAKLLDSLGRNAGTFLPLIMGGLPKPSAQPLTTRPPNSAPAAPSNGNGQSGELGDLAEKIRAKKSVADIEQKDPTKK